MSKSKRRLAKLRKYRHLNWHELAEIAGLNVRQKIAMSRYMKKKGLL